MSDSGRPGAVPLDDPAYHALKDAVIARTGHHYYADKDAQLWERLAARIAATGADGPAGLLALLEAGDAAEWRAIESGVTINETFFFRFAEQFAALRAHILPSLIAARAETRRLRLWSAGCSTGAEAYSLAVLVADLLGPARADWQVTILGTDIDVDALAQAREGVFGAWALRGVEPGERDRLFVAEGSRFRLRSAYRAGVRFATGNLLEPDGDALPFDLILCRNVLIYFSLERAMAVAGALGAQLVDDGWMLLGHAEPGPAAEAGLTAIEVGGALAWRRQADVAAAPPEAAPRSRSVPGRAAPPRTRRLMPTIVPPPPAPIDLTAVRAALAEGRPGVALDLSGRLAALDPADPVPHYLAALAALALDDAGGAEAAFRRALYLRPGFAMAHYVRGRHLLAAGRADEGRRALANAARAVAALPADAPVAESEGMAAGDLADAVRHAIGQAA